MTGQSPCLMLHPCVADVFGACQQSGISDCRESLSRATQLHPPTCGNAFPARDKDIPHFFRSSTDVPIHHLRPSGLCLHRPDPSIQTGVIHM